MSKRRRSNTGIPGLSFSYKRALGITSAKRRFARATGIPTTRSGRRAKAGRMMGCMLPVLAVLIIVSLFVILIGSVAFAEQIDFASLSDDALAQLIADAQAEQRSRNVQDTDAAYQLPCVLLDTEDFKLEITSVSVFDYAGSICIMMPARVENNSAYDVAIDMNIKSFGDYDVTWQASSSAIYVSSGKKAVDQMDFMFMGIDDKTIKDFEFYISIYDKGTPGNKVFTSEILHGLLP